ncbi:MAG TPA: histidine kinase [Gemmatimonadaceae bacterium]|nr:histidine kinase [Gemmatimonadaceae bacterium]
MPRAWLWLQLVIGWLPVWALFLTLIVTFHGEAPSWAAVAAATRLVLAGAVLAPLVRRFVLRHPWPHPMRLAFVALHLGAALAYGAAWFVINLAVESLVSAMAVPIMGAILVPFLLLGAWLYVMIAAVVYAGETATRAARAEGAATEAQLAALRGQLNPHFLFNALHSVVQLTAIAPERAARAAEDLAGLLRVTIDETRDLVPLGDEWRFVQRYLELERMRFGDRLVVDAALDEAAMDALVPAFALQTLVENAVRHGAAPRVEPTTLAIRARRDGERLHLTVRDDGAGATETALVGGTGTGTGLRRLRERLAALYGDRARLQLEAGARGVRATLELPAAEDA